MNKQKFNYHTHTKRCGHAIGEDEDYIKAAIDAGFTTLGFSEHLGYDGWDDERERIPFSRIQEYLDTMEHLKQKYKDQINLRVGFEFEYFEEDEAYLKQIKQSCDYMINGQHAISRNPEHYVHDACSDEDVLLYAKQITQAIKCGLTDYIAHPDYFMLGRKEFSSACAQAINQIAECAQAYHIPIELNLKGLKYGKHSYPYGERYIYPHRETYEIISRYHCDLIYGYDAHNPNVLLDPTLQTQANEVIDGLNLHFLTVCTL